MTFFQHEFDSVEKYLHHRAPYLMVDEIATIEANEITTFKQVTGDEFFVPGHFPGAPIVPGAMMQEMTTQSAGILIAARFNPMESFDTEDPFHNEYALGVLAKVNQARFKGFARPGDRLTSRVVLNERVSHAFDFSATITINDKMIMRNSFQLVNIKSQVLQGVPGGQG